MKTVNDWRGDGFKKHLSVCFVIVWKTTEHTIFKQYFLRILSLNKMNKTLQPSLPGTLQPRTVCKTHIGSFQSNKIENHAKYK